MASQDSVIAREHHSWRGSNRIASIELEDTTVPATNVGEDPKRQQPGWRKFLSYVGPGFLVSLAYIDPGSLEANLQAGATYGYQLLWVISIGMVLVVLIQSLAANLGVTTGKHLAEICKAEYPPLVKYCLWILAEIAVICADIPEVIGTAFALNILFHIPLWAGVLMTGGSTLLLLGLQRYGIRKLELLIASLVFVMAACYFGEMGYVKPSLKELLKGMFVPKLNSNSAIGAAIAVWGALINPHNLFLHSALVLSRKIPQSVNGINSACKYFLIESSFPLFVAYLINVAMISVPGAVCSGDNLSGENADRCNNLTLDSASFLLKNVLGKSSSTIYAIALLASGQSSAITGTYAGQFIMQGFLDMKFKLWKRNLLTRCIAILPSLIVSIISGSAGAGQLIIITSIIMAFVLPLVIIPLLRFSSSEKKMGPHKNSIYIMIVSWILGLGIIGINVYYLSTAFVGWLIHNHLPKVGNIFIGLIVFPFMAIYILALIYLAFKKDTAVTFIDTAPRLQSSTQTQMENGEFNPNDDSHGMADVPYREDLADIPPPQ